MNFRKMEFMEQNYKMNEFLAKNINLGLDFALTILDNLQGSVVFFDDNFEVIMCNGCALNVFSCKNESELSNNFFSFFPEFQNDGTVSRDRFKKALLKTLSDGTSVSEWLLQDSNSNKFTASASFTSLNLVTDENSNCIMVIFQDISPYLALLEKDNEVILNLKKLMDVSPLALTLINKNCQSILCNKQAVLLFNLDNEEQYLKDFLSFSPKLQPNGKLSATLVKEHVEKAFKSGFHKFNWLHCKLSGEEIPCEIVLTKVILNKDEELIAGFTRDLRSEFIDADNDNQYDNYFYNRISDRSLLSNLAELSDEWFFALDTRTSIIQYYGKVVGEFGHVGSVAVKLGVALEKGMVHDGDRELYLELISNMIKGVYKPYDIRYKQKNGEFRYFRLAYKAIYDNNNYPVFVIGKGIDIHEQKLLEEKSRIDLLTGCYNKISAEQIISNKLLTGKDKDHALFIIDIDNFKAVNDNLGHFFGDEVLKEVSGNLKSSFRNHDVIARIGGDEFVVFIENITNSKLIKEKATRIVEAFNRTYSGEYKDYSISGSVGIAFYPNSGSSYDDLYKAADKALYQAKLAGKNRYVIYDKSLVEGTMSDLTKLENADKIASSYFDYDLISAVFNILYERSGDNVSINFALQYICQKYNSDRCYIFETFDRGETYDNTFEWCNEGISSEIANLQKTPRYLYDDFFDTARNGILYSNDLRSLFKSNDAYKLMADQGIKSFVHSQIKKDGYVTFFMGLDDCTKARVWSEKEINSLQYISKIISIMLQGSHLKDELEHLNDYNRISALISDSSDDIVYVSDIDNYELSYLNKAALVGFNLTREEDWKGRKCYEILQQKDAPCEFCTNHIINEDDFYEWTYYNPVINKTYLLKDKLVLIGNKLSRLEIATDISAVTSLEAELKEKLNDERLLSRCINTLHSGVDPNTSINNLLQILAEFHNADRSYIFELSNDGLSVDNTYEWCADGVLPQQDILQNLPCSDLAMWFTKFEEVGEFYINSVCEDISPQSPEYDLLRVQGISSLVTAPIKDSENRLTGFIGVDNPTSNIKKTDLLRAVARFIANFLDETELWTELNRLSYYDTLTEVKNRHSYRSALMAIENVDIYSLGVAYIDIKGLSSINDLYGTDFGDYVIKKVASHLLNEFSDDVYRVGGDEFVIIKVNVEENPFLSSMNRLKKVFQDEKDFNVSLGYTFNKNLSIKDYSNEVVRGKKYSAILSRSLEKEIESGKYVVYLQPQIDIKTGLFTSAEALIRRKNFDGTVQPPLAFLPFFEKEGIVSKIDIFVFETVCKLLKSWNDKKLVEDYKISVNCSRITVSEKNIVTKFSNICKKHSVDTSQIVIEITETISGTCDEVLTEILQQFKDAGFSISLDDFGCGFSNLSTLKLSNFDEIKIDMGITQGLHFDNKSRSLTKVALNLCNELEGLISIAEGIEFEEQLQILNDLNCDKGQGYFFDKPLDIDTFYKKYINKEESN